MYAELQVIPLRFENFFKKLSNHHNFNFSYVTYSYDRFLRKHYFELSRNLPGEDCVTSREPKECLAGGRAILIIDLVTCRGTSCLFPEITNRCNQ